jgi:superfamily II DNA or RNA helicase
MSARSALETLPDRENTNFPLAVFKALEGVKDDHFLLKHQVLPVEFFTKYPKARGLLVMMETGRGKSITTAAIADAFKAQGRRTIIMAAKTLQNNMKANIVKYKSKALGVLEDQAIAEVDKDYVFVSANASNMLGQLKKASQPIELQQLLDEEPDAQVDESSEGDLLDSINLEGTTVVFDEAHHLFNGIVSGSTNARGLYDIIMRTKDIKLVFLTSSVITNTPFELVPCFNMIAGYDLLPTQYADFMDTFIDSAKKTAKNLDHFKARIYGLTSYYGSWFLSGGLIDIHADVAQQDMPTRLAIKEVFVPMSQPQFGAYMMARENEIGKKTYSKKKAKPLSKPSSSGASYRIRSRQLGNFYVPSDGAKKKAAKERTPEDEAREEGQVDTCLADIETHSPKFKAIYENIARHAGQVGMVFSSFLNTYGLNWFAKYLRMKGYTEFKAGDAIAPVGPRYAFISGDMSVEERDAVLAALNSPENKHGEIINLILGSPAMSEGIDTKRIRHVHIMEALWHFTAIEQVIARAVRLRSHDDLPEDERNVQAYIYLADYPSSISSSSSKGRGSSKNSTSNGAPSMDEPTSDVSLYYKSLKKKLLNDQFFRACIEASIDCNIHIKGASAIAKKNIRCMMCAPNNRPMFKRDITQDVASPMECKQTVAQEITVEEIEYAGRKFYYRREANGALHIYEYDEPTSSYVRLSPNSKWYAHIFSKLA